MSYGAEGRKVESTVCEEGCSRTENVGRAREIKGLVIPAWLWPTQITGASLDQRHWAVVDDSLTLNSAS